MTISKPVKIAPGYDNSDWKALKLDRAAPDTPNWRTAIGILKARIHDRFLDPADALIALGKKYRPQRFGFAVLAIDFLVIETLQGFRDGLVDHKVFTNCVPRDRDPQTLAGQVYHDYRCGLLHSAEFFDSIDPRRTFQIRCRSYSYRCDCAPSNLLPQRRPGTQKLCANHRGSTWFLGREGLELIFGSHGLARFPSWQSIEVRYA